jgi:hypothetical protein
MKFYPSKVFMSKQNNAPSEVYCSDGEGWVFAYQPHTDIALVRGLIYRIDDTRNVNGFIGALGVLNGRVFTPSITFAPGSTVYNPDDTQVFYDGTTFIVVHQKAVNTIDIISITPATGAIVYTKEQAVTPDRVTTFFDGTDLVSVGVDIDNLVAGALPIYVYTFGIADGEVIGTPYTENFTHAETFTKIKGKYTIALRQGATHIEMYMQYYCTYAETYDYALFKADIHKVDPEEAVPLTTVTISTWGSGTETDAAGVQLNGEIYSAVTYRQFFMPIGDSYVSYTLLNNDTVVSVVFNGPIPLVAGSDNNILALTGNGVEQYNYITGASLLLFSSQLFPLGAGGVYIKADSVGNGVYRLTRGE